MDKMAHYSKTSVRPSQQLCPNSQSVIKSLPQDSSVFTSRSLIISLDSAQSLQLWGPATQFLTSGPERERFKNLGFMGQHAVGSKAGVVKSMQLLITTSCLSTVHVCLPARLPVSQSVWDSRTSSTTRASWERP